MEKTIVYFAIPKPWLVEKDAKDKRIDPYNDVILSCYDDKLRTFYCPNYRESDLMYVTLPMDEKDIEWLKGKSIEINTSHVATLVFSVNMQIAAIELGIVPHVNWVKVVWEDGIIERFDFSQGQNKNQSVKHDASLFDICLLFDSDNHVQVCIHNAYFNNRDQSAKIEFSTAKKIPMLEEIISDYYGSFSVRTVIQGDYLKKDCFLLERHQTEEVCGNNYIHTGSYAIKRRDIIVKFSMYSDNVVHLKFFKVYKIDREKAKVHASLVLSYKDGVWDNPNPPGRAKNWLSFFINNKDRILKRGKLF